MLKSLLGRMAIFLLIFAVAEVLYDYVEVRWHVPLGTWYELLWTTPRVLMVWLAATWLSHRAKPSTLATPPAPPATRHSSLLLQARSTVLWFYGILAVAAMLLRIALGDLMPPPEWHHALMDYLGPILMTIALIPATYYSRSLVPAGMAIVIMVVLFPELKAQL